VNWKELLGFIAGAITNVGFIPQVWRLFKLKSAHEISLPFILLFLVGVACWLAYGILLNLPPVIWWNAVATAMMCAMLYAKLKYGK
jgi:MtN3 and saliva related transmembrane protein